MKYKHITIKIPILRAEVTVLIGKYKHIKNKFPYGSKYIFKDRDYFARCAFKKVDDCLPFKCVIHSKSAAISVIAHEAVHASTYIMDAMGFESFDDELRAYIVQYICEIVEDALT